MGKHETQRRRRLATLSACQLISLSLLVGCTTDYRRNGDPLVGAPPAPAALPPAALGKPAPPPPPVGSTAAGSTAAVAGGPLRPAANTAGLRIGEAGLGERPGPSRQDSPATLTGAAIAPLPPTPARVVSYEQAQSLLSSRGVRWQWLELRADSADWRFLCRVPSRQNPNINRTYEARGTTHLAAVQAVLDQMDREGY